MRQIRHIRISALIVDRFPVSRTLALCDHLRAGGTVPPIHVQRTVSGQWRVLDGRHRVLAHKLLGRTTILAKHA